MKLRLFALLLIPTLALVTRAADEKPATAPAPGAHPHKDTTELGEHMGKIGRAFRALSKTINDPAKNPESLKLVETIRTNAEAASNLKPAKLADIPADQQAKFLADYQEDMKQFIADVTSLETALKADNNAEAAKIAKKMKADMDEGHKEFRKKKPGDM